MCLLSLLDNIVDSTNNIRYYYMTICLIRKYRIYLLFLYKLERFSSVYIELYLSYYI